MFCGASPGRDPAYAAAARDVGAALAKSGIELVYGGGRLGLMGILADAALAAGGRVTGVIPSSLVDRELAHRDVTDLRIVGTLHERKATMAELSEVLSWAQLGLHGKPIGLLDVNGYFARFVAFLDHATREEFVGRAQRDLLIVEDDLDALLAAFEAWQPGGGRWG